MGTGERVCAHPAILPEHSSIPVLDEGDSFISRKLAYIEGASASAPGPSEKDIAGSLHEALANDDSLAVIGMQALSA